MRDPTISRLEGKVRDLEAQIRALAARVGDGPPPCEYAETVPRTGAVYTSEWYATHPNATDQYGVWLVPLRISGLLRAFRVHTVVRGDGVAVSTFALALYRALLPRFTLGDPQSAALQPRFTFIRAFGQKTVAIGTDPQYMKFDLPVEVLLDPRQHWYVGFQADKTDSRYLCPGTLMGQANITAYRTAPVGTGNGIFPETLTVTGSIGAAPLVWVTSELGEHLYGDATRDD